MDRSGAAAPSPRGRAFYLTISMLLPLLIAAATVAPPDTIPLPGVVLLGELIETPTYVREEPEPVRRLPLSHYVTLPLPHSDTPGLPVHRLEPPPVVGFTRAELDRAVASVEMEVDRGSFPGAAIAIGRWNRTVLERGFGTLDRGLGSPFVDPDHTIYDLASLTKVVAATTAVMLLVEDGRMHLDAPVSRYLPEFSGGDKDGVTIRHLLAHNSGLPAWTETFAHSPEESLRRAIRTPLRARPGQRVEYSDVGFVVLWAAAEAAHGGSLVELLEERVFQPLEMGFTMFNPGSACVRCAPTAHQDGFRGVVHDPIARRLGGVTGNAGLFSTAHDLSRFAAMLVNGGELDGVRVLQRSTIEQFTRRQPGAGSRALGWDTPNARGTGAGGIRISSSAFGHTGFTGTSLWVDPERGTWVILLSNRTFMPVGPNRMQAIRRELNDRVAASVDR
jgi:serine-type D-Ala-D-Ala carboxypeptidase